MTTMGMLLSNPLMMARSNPPMTTLTDTKASALMTEVMNNYKIDSHAMPILHQTVPRFK